MPKLENVLTTIIALVLTAILASVCWLGAVGDQVTYCYVEMSTTTNLPRYTLYGHRSFRLDRTIAVFNFLPEAIQAADAMHCSLNAEAKPATTVTP